MMKLSFEGWFQCRFATDPDPADDPRGVSGPSVQVAGEPPLDRVVRTQDFVCPRWPRSADDGVTVRSVTIGGVEQPTHALLGAEVRLPPECRFQQRNLILVLQNFNTPIDPFGLEIRKGEVRISRDALWDITRPSLTVKDVFLDSSVMATRANTIAVADPEVAEATGFMDFAAVRAQRRQHLADQLSGLDPVKNPIEYAALRKRVMCIDNDRILVGERLPAEQFMGMKAAYTIELNGPPTVEDPSGAMKGTVGTSQLWSTTFWLGGYDVDTLMGYLRGSLSMPFLAQ